MVIKLGKKYGDFKFSIGNKICSYGRNIEIIDKKYVPKQKTKNGIQFVANEKFYKYRCLNCGNEDWVIEYSLDDKQHCGCNACCNPPRKVVKGINDISTTAEWAVPLFKNKDDAYTHHKYSKEKVEFVCPFCSREYIKPIHNVISNKRLSCICGDGISYPNKYMYSLLEQLNVNFEIEKRFTWSNNYIYDFYICRPQNIIIEMHGNQHFNKPIIKSNKRYRTLEEQIIIDKKKEDLALNNGIAHYYQIDCSISDSDYIKDSIIKSGLLDVLHVTLDKVDWDSCDKFSLSNLVKIICLYKHNNPDLTLHDIAKIYKLSYNTVLGYIKTGNKYGWCFYELNSDREITEILKKVNRGQKPIYCETNDTYYRDSNVASLCLSTDNNVFYSRQIRNSISRNNKYKGFKFSFISQLDFNNAKSHSPDKTVGDFFNISD